MVDLSDLQGIVRSGYGHMQFCRTLYAAKRVQEFALFLHWHRISFDGRLDDAGDPLKGSQIRWWSSGSPCVITWH